MIKNDQFPYAKPCLCMRAVQWFESNSESFVYQIYKIQILHYFEQTDLFHVKWYKIYFWGVYKLSVTCRYLFKRRNLLHRYDAVKKDHCEWRCFFWLNWFVIPSSELSILEASPFIRKLKCFCLPGKYEWREIEIRYYFVSQFLSKNYSYHEDVVLV